MLTRILNTEYRKLQLELRMVEEKLGDLKRSMV